MARINSLRDLNVYNKSRDQAQVRLRLSVNKVFFLSSRREERAGEGRCVGALLLFPRNPSLQLSPRSFLAGREESQLESLTDTVNRTHQKADTVCRSSARR